MSEPLDPEVVHALERGSFCHVVTRSRFGPHLTPMVFALSEGRLWVTTSRSSVKARAWRQEPSVGGFVRAGETGVMFAGRVRTYDLLDARSWQRALRQTPALAAASLRFTRKNARFFAGYAVDAHHVPLSWTPPGRVFVEIELERTALVDHQGVRRVWGTWPSGVASRAAFRADRRGREALRGLPRGLLKILGHEGRGVLGVEGTAGLVALPAGWALDGPALYAVAPIPVLELAGMTDPAPTVALGMDRPSWWRARLMVGAMVQGRAEVAVPDLLRSGRASAVRHLAQIGSGADRALLRLRPHRLVWWEGWTSGSARV